MLAALTPFLLHWLITALSLWAAAHVFKGLSFDSPGALAISALLLGLVNAVVRPILLLLTLPITVVTFGLFILVVNALMLLLVARLVRGFRIAGFWSAFFASLFITVLSLVLAALLGHASGLLIIEPPGQGPWI